MGLYYSASTGGFYNDAIHTRDQIPSDAVSVTEDTHLALLSAQSSGKRITADNNGNPVATDSPAPTNDELSVSARQKRDVLLAETDYLLMPDYPITTDKLELVKTYRQLLRDITKQASFPANIEWPKLS